MKLIRYFTVILFLLTGILHLSSSLREFTAPNAIPILAFGVIYFALGILIFFNIRFSLISGIAFPFLGLGASLVVGGFHDWTAMTTLIYGIYVLVIICCIVLLTRETRKKKA